MLTSQRPQGRHRQPRTGQGRGRLPGLPTAGLLLLAVPALTTFGLAGASTGSPSASVSTMDAVDLSLRSVERADRSQRANLPTPESPDPEVPHRALLVVVPAPAPAPEPAPAPSPAPTARPTPTATPTPSATATAKPSPTPSPSTTTTTKAAPAAPAGISAAACADGSSVEVGLTRDAIRVHRAVCALFTGISGYGGVRGSGDYHGTGQALDIMVGSSGLGDQIAAYVRANAKVLGVSEVIWSQHIWTVQRSSEGWRAMSDRGSPTANHYDHVHVSVYGSAGG